MYIRGLFDKSRVQRISFPPNRCILFLLQPGEASHSAMIVRWRFVLRLIMSTTNQTVELPPLIPRDLLFDNPERRTPQISPDGTRLAWLAPDSNNVMQVWVQTLGKDDSKVLTADKKTGIRSYFWAYDNRTLLYQQDSDGDENFHVFGVDLDSENVRDFSPLQGVRAECLDLSPDYPNTALISMNARNRQIFDIYRLNLQNGALDLDTENPGDVSGWTADAKMQVRLAHVILPDGGTELRIRDDAPSAWKSWINVSSEEILHALGFTGDGKSVYLLSSIGRDTAAVIEKSLIDDSEKVIAASDEVDASEVMIHPRRHVVEAVKFSPDRATWHVVDPAVRADFAALAKLDPGTSRSSIAPILMTSGSSRLCPTVCQPAITDGSRRTAGHIPVQQPAKAGEPAACGNETGHHPRARRAEDACLSHTAGGRAREESADGAFPPRRSLASRHLGLQFKCSAARQPRLRGAAAQFPWLHRVWEKVHERRRQAMGIEDAR